MKKIRFVVDSTFGVSDQYRKQHQIVVNPLSVIIDDKSFLDDVEIKLYDVLDAVDAGKKVTTSQPNPSTYKKIYDDLFLEGADQIICLTVSSTLSGTVQSATIARNDHQRRNDIFVHDTLAAHIEALLLLETAVEAAEKGKTAPEIIDIIKANKVDSGILLSIKNLDILFKSGRLSRLMTIIGNLLHVKPIILYRDTKLDVIKKVRSDQKLFEFIADYVKELSGRVIGTLRMKITHIKSYDRAETLLNFIKKIFPGVNVSIGVELNPVLAIHISNGGIGLAWIFEK